MPDCCATGVIIILLLTQLPPMHTFQALSLHSICQDWIGTSFCQEITMAPVAKPLGIHHCSDLSIMQLQIEKVLCTEKGINYEQT